MAARLGHLTSSQQHDPKVVLGARERDSVVEGFLDGHRALCVMRGLADVAELLVRNAHSAVENRKPAQVLDHVACRDRLLISLDRGFPPVIGRMHAPQDPKQPALRNAGNRVERPARRERSFGEGERTGVLHHVRGRGFAAEALGGHEQVS